MRPLPLLLLTTLLYLSQCETSPVHVSSKFSQPITSSLLSWVPKQKGDPAPEHSVIGAVENGVENPKAVYVCRVQLEGMWISGQVSPVEDNCIVSMHGVLYRRDSYEILENTDDGARLSWARWDKYSQIPPGTVTCDGTNYIARRASPLDTYSHQLGRLERDGLGKISVITEDGVYDHEDGEVLVETEPVSYNLSKVKYNLWRKRVISTPKILGKTNLTNTDEYGEVSKVETVIQYSYNYSVNWGHIHSVITGLPVTVRLINGTELESFKWGIDTHRHKQELYDVEAKLAPGTAVEVTLKGNYTDATVPYAGILTAIYADGEKRPRQTSGNRRELSMWHIYPEFGPVYFIANGSHVPTTTTTTTTTTSTTSTTTPTTTSSSTTEPPPIPPSPIEKMNVTDKKLGKSRPSDKGENSVMQNDEGAKTAGSTSSASILLAPLAIMQVIIVHRIT